MDWLETISLVITAIISILATFFTQYILFKRKLRAVREFIDKLDDALYDDRITEDEYKELWEKFKAILNR
jgi:hypothetical protein